MNRRPTEATRRAVLARQGGRCAGILDSGERCEINLVELKRNRAMHRYFLSGGRRPVEFDHIVPHCDGGGNEAKNIQALCGPCHARKTLSERPGWDAPTPSVYAGRLAAKPAPQPPRPPSKALRLRGKAPQLHHKHAG